jgi:transcription elongation factor GreB
MNKAFTKDAERNDDFDEESQTETVPAGFKNYIRPSGLQKLKDELLHLLDIDRPEIVRVVSWAASNGDRSENGDYLYGKKRLREIDRRIRFLTKRIDSAVPVKRGADLVTTDIVFKSPGELQVFFGASVLYALPSRQKHQVTIVGVDEVAPDQGLISWISPMAKALIRARAGDEVKVQTPQGPVMVEVLEVNYDRAN